MYLREIFVFITAIKKKHVSLTLILFILVRFLSYVKTRTTVKNCDDNNEIIEILLVQTGRGDASDCRNEMTINIKFIEISLSML